jgi:hypothetical protein
VAIVSVGLFAAPPMAFAACSFTWGGQGANPVFHVSASQQSFGYYGTLNGVSATSGGQNFYQSGDFTLTNPGVNYQNNDWWYENSPGIQAISFASSTSGVTVTGILTPGAKAGQVAYVYLNVTYNPYPGGMWNPLNWAGTIGCSSRVMVVVDAVCSGNAALIQSTYGGTGNFEVVFPNDQISSVGQVRGAGIAHYFRNNSSWSSQPWYSDTFFESTAGPVDAVSLIESSFGNLEAVARIGTRLAHSYRDWEGSSFLWHDAPPTYFGSGVSGTPSFIQSKSGNFEVVTPLAAGGMAHYSRVGNTWGAPQAFAAGYNVSDVSLIESSYGNLEVVARMGSQLIHFYRDHVSGAWSAGMVFANGASGTPSLIQGPSSSSTPGNFEVVTPLAAGGSAHYFRDNSRYSYQPWYGPTAHFGSGNVGSAALIHSNYGNLEVVSRANCTVDHYYRNDLYQWSGPTTIVP